MKIYEMLESLINCDGNEAGELIEKYQLGKIDRVVCRCFDEHPANSRGAIYILEHGQCIDCAAMKGMSDTLEQKIQEDCLDALDNFTESHEEMDCIYKMIAKHVLEDAEIMAVLKRNYEKSNSYVA